MMLHASIPNMQEELGTIPKTRIFWLAIIKEYNGLNIINCLIPSGSIVLG